jgi:hypothetical protein
MQAESIIGVIPNARIKTGMFSTTMYTLVFTNYRLLMAEATKDVVARLIEQARASKKADGGGFFAQWGAQLGASIHFADHYRGLTPDQVLAESPGNGALTPADVRELKFESKSKDVGNDDSPVHQDYLKITLVTAAGKKQEFNTDTEDPDVRTARAMAASVFGGAVR